MAGRKTRKTSADARARTRASAKSAVHLPDILTVRCPAGTRAGIAEAARLDGVSPAEWHRGLVRKGLEASRRKRARRGR